MTNTDSLLYLIGAIILLVVVAVAVFLVVRSRRKSRPSKEIRPSAESPVQVVPPEAQPSDRAGDQPARGPPEQPTEPVQIAPVLDVPEPAGTRMQRLRARLARSGSIGAALLSVLSRGDLSESDWEEIEETLLIADVGMDATTEILARLRTEIKVAGTVSAAEARTLLRAILLDTVGPDMDRSLNLDAAEGDPATMIVVGVNGTGKTTTVGKIARLLRSEERDVVLGAADTFRAAAAEQLTTWGDRVGVPVVSAEKEGADPAAVAFEAVARGKADGADVVLVDTAGRLQNKSTLMDELGKIKRVMEKQAPVSEVLLVLDATTGQNGMRQAEVFADVVGVTGIALTKLDGSAKGGIVISVQRELGVPVKLVGLGEGPDDLAPFDPAGFVDALLGE